MTQAGQEIVTHKLLTKKLRSRKGHGGRGWWAYDPLQQTPTKGTEADEKRPGAVSVRHGTGAQLLSEFLLLLMLESDQRNKCLLLRKTKHSLPFQRVSFLTGDEWLEGTA